MHSGSVPKSEQELFSGPDFSEIEMHFVGSYAPNIVQSEPCHPISHATPQDGLLLNRKLTKLALISLATMRQRSKFTFTRA
jgi:hypothetical protein